MTTLSSCEADHGHALAHSVEGDDAERDEVMVVVGVVDDEEGTNVDMIVIVAEDVVGGGGVGCAHVSRNRDQSSSGGAVELYGVLFADPCPNVVAPFPSAVSPYPGSVVAEGDASVAGEMTKTD